VVRANRAGSERARLGIIADARRLKTVRTMRTATLAHSADPLPSGGDFIPTDQVGVLLQEARLRAGLDLRLVAEDLRIRYHHLLALEKGRFGDLPGPTYVTGFIRAYAEYLGLDAEEIVRRHKSETGADAAGSRRLEFPVPARDGSVSAGLFLIVALVLVGAGFGGWFWMSSRDLTMAQALAGLQTRVVAVFTEPSGADSDRSEPGGSDPDRAPEADAPADPAQVAAADGQDQPDVVEDSAEDQPEAGTVPDGDGEGEGDQVAALDDSPAEGASTDPLEAALDGGADATAPAQSDPSNAAEPQTAADDPPQDSDETGVEGTDTAADPGQDSAPEQMTAASDETNEDGPVIPVPPEPPSEITEPETEPGQEAATDPPSQDEAAAPDVPGLTSAEEPAGDDAQPGETEDASAASVQVADNEAEAEVEDAEALPPVPETPDGDGTVDADAADAGPEDGRAAETNGEATADTSPQPDAESPDAGEAPLGDASADETASDQPAEDATDPGEGEQPAGDEPAAENGAEAEEEAADPAQDEEQPEQPEQQEAEEEAEPEEEAPPAYVGRPAPASVREAGGGARIVLRANRDAWIQVRRGGDLVVRRLLRRGDTYAVPRGAGYTLNTTNAGGLEVYVDGRRRPNLGPVGASRNGIRLTPGALN